MAFMPVASRTGDRWAPKSRVHVYFTALRHNGRGSVIITMSRSVTDKLKWMPGDRIMPQVGVIDDFGKLMLSRIRAGGIKLGAQNGGNAMLRISFVPPEFIGEVSHADYMATFTRSEDCEFEVVKGQLFVKLTKREEQVHFLRAAE